MRIKKSFLTTATLLTLSIVLASCTVITTPQTDNTVEEEQIPTKMEEPMNENNLSTIYLAGGCFWGVEEYMDRIPGVYDAVSGYANGRTENPTYEDVLYKDTGHAETVRVRYNKEQVSLDELLEKFFRVVDPVSVNRQGNDVGTSYRSGIYYTDESDLTAIEERIAILDEEYEEEIAVEVQPLENFGVAEEYHQDYLKKNPNGYCHIDLDASWEDYQPVSDEVTQIPEYPVASDEELQEILTPLQYSVTRLDDTERPFYNEYNDNKEPGIYVDIATGEPLFSSEDKFDSGTGWPSFTRPIVPEVITEHVDNGLFTTRTEVRSRSGDSHLGHVFNDGPKNDGGLRYCINSASLNFIHKDDLEANGYDYLLHLFE